MSVRAAPAALAARLVKRRGKWEVILSDPATGQVRWRRSFTQTN